MRVSRRERDVINAWHNLKAAIGKPEVTNTWRLNRLNGKWQLQQLNRRADGYDTATTPLGEVWLSTGEFIEALHAAKNIVLWMYEPKLHKAFWR